ncbi:MULTISPECIES: ArpU family transcriptional regulator [Bacillus]|uniref:ArpU family transcriptional regulator n=1 Tax=Bacillus TaxID=1386 RepID=UPI0004688589|nr:MULTISPECIES: ArpU family transcriptional regulator [Bacillus]MED1412583.1 ArpU family transcriptional regulator [Bacillus paramycoides]MED1463753.1 ArpU family transcriptional regulator [Bacillus paramycoides]MED1495350.1 ArpU family transcriptional regulator [Bacillus paramycoides]
MEKQLTLLPAIDKETEKKVQKEVVSILKEYRGLKICFENEAEQRQEGISLFPEICDTKRANQIKLKQVEKALMHSLDEVKIIEMKYLSNKKLKDDFIYNELLIKKDAFYAKKKNVIRLIATALGMI